MIDILSLSCDSNTPTIDSREVAAMVEKRHDNIVRDIRSYIQNMDDSIALKIEVNDFFIESSYLDLIGRTLPCYLVTRKGCEFIANKLTGQKGTLFTATYINRFHELERSNTSNLSHFSPQLQVLISMELKQKELERQLTETSQKVEAAQTAITNIKETIIERDEDWRQWINAMFNKAVANTKAKDHQTLRRETYELLESRARCRLSIRLANLKERLTEAGATKTKINTTSKMDAIESDPRLKEIYTTIIKELAVRYTA